MALCIEEWNETAHCNILCKELIYLIVGNAQCLQWTQYCHSLANLLKASGVVLCKTAYFLKCFPSVLVLFTIPAFTHMKNTKKSLLKIRTKN